MHLRSRARAARGLLPDNWNFASNTPCLHRGGNYNRNQNYGMFYLNYNSASNANANNNMQGMDVPQDLGNPKIAGPGTYWSYNADTKTMTISGDGAYAGATNDEQLGSGTYTSVVVGADVSRLLGMCMISKVSVLVLLQPTDDGIVIDPKFNSSSKLNVYTDCTAAIAALKAVVKPENITVHSLSEWAG